MEFIDASATERHEPHHRQHGVVYLKEEARLDDHLIFSAQRVGRGSAPRRISTPATRRPIAVNIAKLPALLSERD
jgi:hypothetical protein